MIKKILLSLLILAALLLIFNSSYAGEGFRIKNTQSVFDPTLYAHPWDDPVASSQSAISRSWDNYGMSDRNASLGAKFINTFVSVMFFLNGNAVYINWITNASENSREIRSTIIRD
ncbi:exported hypothetical protein [Candidatus Zixiibacteriota bacterium]|nr:exported hypothetical protein [candidate division Zixibacteria bacterium]